MANCQVASFTYSTSNGSFCNPSAVHFTQTATGNQVGYIWDLHLIHSKIEELNDISRPYAERVMDKAISSAMKDKSVYEK